MVYGVNGCHEFNLNPKTTFSVTRFKRYCKVCANKRVISPTILQLWKYLYNTGGYLNTIGTFGVFVTGGCHWLQYGLTSHNAKCVALILKQITYLS